MSEEEMVTIPKSRLQALEALEEKWKQGIQKLRREQTEDPKGYAKKVLAKYHENKETINARRRELYKQKKAKKEEAEPTV